MKVAEQDVINWKELTAVRLALESHVGDLQGLRVINRTDNVATLAALNKRRSRFLPARRELAKIAVMCMRHKIGIRAVHIKGIENPADAPSRGIIGFSGKDFTFAHCQDFNRVPHVIDCCAAINGYNAQPGCSVWFSATNPAAECSSSVWKEGLGLTKLQGRFWMQSCKLGVWISAL